MGRQRHLPTWPGLLRPHSSTHSPVHTVKVPQTHPPTHTHIHTHATRQPVTPTEEVFGPSHAVVIAAPQMSEAGRAGYLLRWGLVVELKALLANVAFIIAARRREKSGPPTQRRRYEGLTPTIQD
ncbi:unnamed protein product [Protopolystoma xenopodis]|uniref:Uncharacterized protein n=1 Tax=Protopolystoma xenopodis TaxID=117903 RepID=A0A448XA51_9PLAT|nr:unnamed protein product [Protopolystoma xenopodis]